MTYNSFIQSLSLEVQIIGVKLEFLESRTGRICLCHICTTFSIKNEGLNDMVFKIIYSHVVNIYRYFDQSPLPSTNTNRTSLPSTCSYRTVHSKTEILERIRTPPPPKKN